MSNLFAIQLIVLALLSDTCSTAQQATDTVVPVKEPQSSFYDEGFTRGVVVHFSEYNDPCRWMIRIDTLRLIELLEFPEHFKTDSLKVWIKYWTQLRPSHCLHSMPAEIDKIFIRNEGE